MILKNAAAFIYVVEYHVKTNRSFDNFLYIYEYLKKKNTNNFESFIFVNKMDL